MKLPFDMNEWHTFVLGFAEGMNPKKPQVPYPVKVRGMIKAEYWYYRTGFGIAAVAWFGLAALVIILVI